MPEHFGPFDALVEQLLEDHLNEDNEPEGALLPMLYDSIASSSGRGSAPGGGGSKASAPLDLDALDLWDSIARDIRDNTDFPNTYSEIDLLKLWIAEVGDFIPAQLDLMEYMVKWRNAIRTKFEPPKIIPIRQVDCPMCRATKDSEGAVPLELHARKDSPFATCTNCGHRWEGGELLDLRALIK